MSAPSQHVICDWFKIYILRCTSITLRRDGQRAATDGQKNQSPTFQPRRNANFLFSVRFPEGRNLFFFADLCISPCIQDSRMINPSNPPYNIWRHNAIMPLHLMFRFPREATGLCTSRTWTPARGRGRSWTAAASTATPRTTPAARAAAPADTPSSSRGRTSGPSPRRSVRKIFESPLKNIYCTMY